MKKILLLFFIIIILSSAFATNPYIAPYDEGKKDYNYSKYEPDKKGTRTPASFDIEPTTDCIKTINWVKPSFFNIDFFGTNGIDIITDPLTSRIEIDGSDAFESTTYYPETLIVVHGTDETNDIETIKYYDSDAYVISEASGINPLTVDINFVDVEDFGQIVIREHYIGSASHHIEFQLWDYVENIWEGYYDIVGQEGYTVITIPSYDSTDHIGTGVNDGNVQFRFEHTGTGISSHDLNVDFIWLIEGINIGASTNLEGFAKYSFGDNDFNGTGDYTTTGNIKGTNLTATDELTSDANLLCTDSVCYNINDLNDLGAGAGDNLGDHTATENLKMGGFDIDNAKDGNFTGNVTVDENVHVGENITYDSEYLFVTSVNELGYSGMYLIDPDGEGNLGIASDEDWSDYTDLWMNKAGDRAGITTTMYSLRINSANNIEVQKKTRFVQGFSSLRDANISGRIYLKGWGIAPYPFIDHTITGVQFSGFVSGDAFYFDHNITSDYNVTAGENFCFENPDSCISSFFTEADGNNLYLLKNLTSNDTEVQYNDAGTLAGASGLTYDKVNSRTGIGGAPAGGLGGETLKVTGNANITENLKIDNPPRARMYKNNAQNIPSGGASATKVEFDADSYDSDNITDPTVGYDITPNETGYYLINASVKVNPTVDGKYYRVYVYVGGVLVARTDHMAGGATLLSSTITTIQPVTAGQAIDVRFYHNTGVNLAIQTGSAVSWFEVHRLS